ncbi:hypothetical protein AALD01_19690 [Oscillospiraceae bacterium 21-37]
MERKDFVNILSLAVTSAFPEVDEVVLYRRDIIHIYFNDDSFMEINVGDSDNASLLVNIWAGLWRDRSSLGEDVPETIATVFRGQIKYNGESYTDIFESIKGSLSAVDNNVWEPGVYGWEEAADV